MADNSMKTLDEHNEAVVAELQKKEQARLEELRKIRAANVACPTCGKEMLYKEPYFMRLFGMTSFPKSEVECECGHTGYKLEGKAE